jgi:hypothetical protein
MAVIQPASGSTRLVQRTDLPFPFLRDPAFTIVKQSQTAPQSDMSDDGPDSAFKVQKANSGQAL